MITLDFSGLHEPKCKGVEKPGTDESDFEYWSPHDDGRHGSTDKCFLGHKATYVRRKQDSECFNGEDHEKQTLHSSCVCTEADFECDMNYIRNKGGKCEAVQDPFKNSENRQLTEKEEDCAFEGFYYLSQGYRKIPGNSCQGGLKLDPVRKPCSGLAFVTSFFNLKTMGIVALLGVIMYYGWPILEAIILILPIPDPKHSIEWVKGLIGGVFGFVNSFLTSAPRQ